MNKRGIGTVREEKKRHKGGWASENHYGPASPDNNLNSRKRRQGWVLRAGSPGYRDEIKYYHPPRCELGKDLTILNLAQSADSPDVT